MFVLEILRWLLLVGLLCLVGPILYLDILSISALRAEKRRRARGAAFQSLQVPSVNFAILVPAHNEELMLGALLENLAALAYPQELYTVYVVADNCTDSTAELVRATGWAHVYERINEVKRGKGYALNWLLQKLEDEQLIYDAYVIVDADSLVDSHFLKTLAVELGRGERALQARGTVLNSSEAPSSALRWIALSLINYVRPLGRNGLGGSAALSGNGMCLSREILRRYPWRAFSVGEDYEYYLTLVEHGERVTYVPEAVIRSHMPTRFAQMRTQDIRWESEQPTRRSWLVALNLLRAGLRSRDVVRIDACAELLVPPLSLLVSFTLLALLAALVLGSPPAWILSLVLVGGLVGHIGTAFYLLRPPRSVYKGLLYAPGFVIWKLWVYFVLRKNRKLSKEWVRTSRTLSVR